MTRERHIRSVTVHQPEREREGAQSPVVPADIADRVVQRRNGGALVADIAHELGMSPVQVLNVLEAAGHFGTDAQEETRGRNSTRRE
jgi:hypothetical protein